MTELPLSNAVDMLAALQAMGPPQQVMQAATDCLTIARAGGRVPTDLLTFVQRWIGRQQQQDRYGK